MRQVTEEDLYEIALKLLPADQAISLMLSEGSVRYLINEEIDQADIDKMLSALGDVNDVVGKLGALRGKMPALNDYLASVDAAVKTAGTIAKDLNLENPKGMKKKLGRFFGQKVDLEQAMRGVMSIYNDVSTVAGQITGAAKLITTNLEGDIPDENDAEGKNQRDAMLGAAAEAAGRDIESIRSGFGKAFDEAKPKKLAKLANMFKTAGGKIKGVDIPEFPMDQFINQAPEKLSFNDLVSLGALKDELPPPEESAEMGEEINQDAPAEGDPAAGEEATADAEEVTGEDAELAPEELEAADAEAEEVAAQLGSGPIGKLELTALLKKFPEISGKGDKATRHRRSFRKAINTAAGSGVFEEAYDYSQKKFNLLMEELIEPEEDQEMTRWRKLAGLE